MHEQILSKLKSHANQKNIDGMARFGINPNNTLGVSVPVMRKMAKEIGRNHGLALQLWDSGIHEARILASMVDDPKLVTEAQLEKWVNGFDSWDVCDQCCMNLFDKTEFAYPKAIEWCKRENEFVRRAAFALMAALAVHDKKANDGQFERFLPKIKKYSFDERNFVKKAVNWALRQIGKRNANLNRLAIETANQILRRAVAHSKNSRGALREGIAKIDSRAARWIAADALGELESEKIQEKIGRKSGAI